MQFSMLSMLNFNQKFFYIINNRYIEIINAKYDSFMINDTCTVSLDNYVSLPAKVVRLIAFFFKKKAIFVWLLCWPLAGQLGSQLMRCL